MIFTAVAVAVCIFKAPALLPIVLPICLIYNIAKSITKKRSEAEKTDPQKEETESIDALFDYWDDGHEL